MVPAQYFQSLKNIPTKVKKIIYAVGMYENYLVITCNAEIPSVDNTLKKTGLGIPNFNEFASPYHDNKNGFSMLST